MLLTGKGGDVWRKKKTELVRAKQNYGSSKLRLSNWKEFVCFLDGQRGLNWFKPGKTMAHINRN